MRRPARQPQKDHRRVLAGPAGFLGRSPKAQHVGDAEAGQRQHTRLEKRISATRETLKSKGEVPFRSLHRGGKGEAVGRGAAGRSTLPDRISYPAHRIQQLIGVFGGFLPLPCWHFICTCVYLYRWACGALFPLSRRFRRLSVEPTLNSAAGNTDPILPQRMP